MRRVLVAVVTPFVLCLAAEAKADFSITIASPNADTSIYSESQNAGGAGTHVYAGDNSSSAARRALIRFNIAGAGIPAGSTITSSTLNLYASLIPSTPPASTLNLWRVTANWGEGSTVPASGGGHGGTPATGATWSYAFYNGTGWSNGASNSGISYGSLNIGTGSGWKAVGVTTTLVQNWLDGTWSNYGFVITGTESGAKTTRGFDSSEGTNHPTLDITYKAPDGTSCTLNGQCISGHCTDSHCCNVASCTAAGECYNVGVCNAAGVCTNPPKGSGVACSSDGNNCTLDQCDGAGTCAHPAGNNGAACPDDGNECTNDQCNGVSTVCQHPAKSLGTACTADANPCTLDQCNGSGSCTHPAGNNGAGCTDNDACTQSDSCSGGVCVGSNPVVCSALDQCHVAGICNPANGVCSNPSAPLGTGCTPDSNPCTLDQCNGSGSCTHPAGNPGSQCSGPSCACPGGNCTATLASNCDGVSTTCPTASQVSCMGALCNGNVCAGGCVIDGDCSNGYFCLGGACTQKYDDGIACAANNYCKNAHCVDSTCCATTCPGGAGDCQACNVAGHLGTCFPIPANTLCRAAAGGGCDVADYCDGAGTTCVDSKVAGGTTCRASAGQCDVLEACDGTTNSCPANAFVPSTTQCRAASCTAGVETHAANCPGNGAACPAVVTQPCGTYACGATACKTTCSSDGDCATGNWCSGNACVPKYDNGIACGALNQCKSSLCVDGVCCDKACNGQCEACDASGSTGTCTPVAGAPHGSRSACAADGSSCSGACNGSLVTACTYPGNATVCRSAECTAGIATVQANCQGAGTCPTKQTVTCDPFVCGATACLGNCANDVDCIAGDYCAGGICKPQLNNGDACGSSHECSSDYCVDGVCCNTACKGQCEACDAAGSEGTCTAVSGAPHGPRPACVTDGTSCDGSCDGNDRSKCDYPGTGTVCRQASCSNDTATLLAFCNGTGVCPPLQQQDCAPAACGATTCNGDCLVDGDCSVNEYCSAGVCTLKLDNGGACGGGSQCKSSTCVDGVCCNTACSGQCEACDLQGQVGTCSPVVGSPKGVRAPCASDGSACGGTCDGIQRAGCEYAGAATQCRQASCASNVAILAASCNATGACPSQLAVSCTPNTCSGTICGGGCTTDAQCAGSEFCAGGVCTTKFQQGSFCSADEQCGSAHCVDGFCCDTACSGQCQACDVVPNVGTCSTLTSGQPHGGRPACEGTGLCVGTCDGSSASACKLPGATTTCGAAACTGGVLVSAATCNGGGSCLAPAFTNCAPYGCAGTSCLTTCASTNDCALGYECTGTTCTPIVVVPDAGADADAGNDASDSGVDSSPDGSAGSAGATATGGAGGATAGSGGTGTGGSGGSGGATGGTSGSGAAGTGGASASGGSSGSGVDSGADSGKKPGAASSDAGSCGCRVPGGNQERGAGALLALIGLAALTTRRRRRGTDPRA